MMTEMNFDPKILARILLLQNTLHVAPDIQRCCEMIRRSITEIPGVSDCIIDLDVDVNIITEFPDDDSITRFSIRTSARRYGLATLHVTDMNTFQLYRPIAENSVNLLALHIENLKTVADLKNLNESLDETVHLRTQALLETERHLSTLMENLPGFAYRCRFDEYWTMLILSRSCLDLTGYHSSEIINNTRISYKDLIHADDQEYVHRTVKAAVDQELPFEIEYRLIKKDGTIRIVWEKGIGVFKDGKLKFIEGFITDVTQRKQAESEIKRRLDYEKILSEISLSAIDVTDMDSYLNNSLKTLGVHLDLDRVYIFNCNESKNIISNTHEWVSDSINSQIDDLQNIPTDSITWWMNCISNDQVINFSDIVDIPSETVREILAEQDIKSILVVPLFIGRNLYGFIGFDECRNNRVWSDTDVLFLRSVSRIMSDAIGRKINTEQKEKLEEQIRQIQKLESIGRLAGGIAHDLNNLLVPILGYSEMILEDINEKDPRREAVSEIEYAGNRARDLVRQLLAFSRKQTMSFQPVNLFKVLQNFQKLLRRTIREEINLVFDLDPSLPPVRGDIGQLEQVIMNLAINAQDAMPEGGELCVKVNQNQITEEEQEIPPGKYIFLTVSDNGTGISDDILPNIFEPFFTTKRKHRGTGLGLSTAYGIVKQHDGYLKVDSTPNKGTTFSVILPIMDSLSQSPAADQQKGRKLFGSESILIAEDNLQIRRLTESILKRHGYTVYVAENGVAALNLLRQESITIDLLLTDVIMPDLNGKQLYEKARKFRPNLRVAYMSGYPDKILNRKGVRHSKDILIPKPFTIHTLTKSIRDALEI